MSSEDEPTSTELQQSNHVRIRAHTDKFAKSKLRKSLILFCDVCDKSLLA